MKSKGRRRSVREEGKRKREGPVVRKGKEPLAGEEGKVMRNSEEIGVIGSYFGITLSLRGDRLGHPVPDIIVLLYIIVYAYVLLLRMYMYYQYWLT